jgi:hypothetical protein
MGTERPKYGQNDRGETQFDGIDSIETFAEACRIAERERVLKGRIVVDASRYVFLPFSRLRKHPLLLKIMHGRDPERLDVRIMAENLTRVLGALMGGKRLPENICAELMENHLESPLRSWCETLIAFRRIVKLESTQEDVLQRTNDALRNRKGLTYALSAPVLWIRWFLNKTNLIMLKFQIDFAVFLVGFFITRRHNVVEIAWEIDGNRLTIEAANNAKIPKYLAAMAAERAELARQSVLEPAKLGDVHSGIRRQNKPLSGHLLSGSGLGILMVTSIALKNGGSLSPPRYDPERRRTVAVFTADIESLPAAT